MTNSLRKPTDGVRGLRRDYEVKPLLCRRILYILVAGRSSRFEGHPRAPWRPDIAR
jgi:hypothetical protein